MLLWPFNNQASVGGLQKCCFGCNYVSCPAGGTQALTEGIEDGHLSDDEGEGGEDKDKKKKKLKKKKKKVAMLCACC